jgi:hypothetical protein
MELILKLLGITFLMLKDEQYVPTVHVRDRCLIGEHMLRDGASLHLLSSTSHHYRQGAPDVALAGK